MGAFPIVLLPGMHGTAELMGPLAASLATEREAHIIDYPVDIPLGYEALVPYITERLPPGRFVILGESFGGPLAIEIAARLPARAAGLILAVTFARNPLPRWLRYFARLAPIHPAFSPLVNAVMLGKFTRTHPEIVQGLRAIMTEVSPNVARLRMTEALTVNKTTALAATTCPLLYLAGTRDRLIRRHCLRTILATRPDAQVRQFDAPHMLLETRAPAVAAVIHQFCDELPG